MSSESYPGYPECVVSCHGAGRLTNSIRAITVHFLRDCIGHVTGSLDHLIRQEGQRWRHRDSELLGGFEVNDQLKLQDLLCRQVGRFDSL